MTPPRGLTEAEAEELWRFTRNDYVNPNINPALHRLFDDLGRWADKTGRTLVTTR